jgi:hypothetical protein
MEPEYSEVDKYQKVVSHATKIWSFRFPCDYRGNEISKLYSDGTNYRQTIALLDGIFTLTIPASQVNEATFIRVSDFDLHQQGPNADLHGLGLNKGYCVAGQKLYRFGYKVDSTKGAYENGATFDSRLRRILELFQSFSFDEELGRLVSVTRSHFVFQDFSLPLYNMADVCPDSDRGTEEVVWYKWR